MPRMDEVADKKIFIGGLNYETDDKGLREYFCRYGDLADYIVMKTPDGRSRGFGFVTFESSDAMENALAAAPHTIDGRTVELKRAQPREALSGGGGGGGYRKRGHDDDDTPVDPEDRLLRKLFIGGLNYITTEEDMKGYFSKYGAL